MDPSSRLRVASPADEADRAVLVRLADGELDALGDLYDRYKTMAYSIAYRITNDATLAEDVVQEAFLGAWRNAARYVEGRGSVKTWLLAIVHHRAIDAVRRRRPTTELPDVELPPPDALRLPDVWAEVAAGLDAATVQGALATLVRRPARGDRAGLLQRADPAGDRRPDGDATGDRQEPDAPRPAGHAPAPGSGVGVSESDAVRDLTHEEVLELAGAFVLGALEPADEAAVRAHLATCSRVPRRDRRARRRAAGPRRERADRRAAGRAAGADHGRRGRGPRRALGRGAGGPGVRRRPRAIGRPSPVATTPAVAPRRDRRVPGSGRARRAARATDLDRHPVAAHRRGLRHRRARWAEPAARRPAQRRAVVPGRRRVRARGGRPARVADRDPDRGRRDRLRAGGRQCLG